MRSAITQAKREKKTKTTQEISGRELPPVKDLVIKQCKIKLPLCPTFLYMYVIFILYDSCTGSYTDYKTLINQRMQYSLEKEDTHSTRGFMSMRETKWLIESHGRMKGLHGISSASEVKLQDPSTKLEASEVRNGAQILACRPFICHMLTTRAWWATRPEGDSYLSTRYSGTKIEVCGNETSWVDRLGSADCMHRPTWVKKIVRPSLLKC